jgi:hypothetical protein
LHKYVVCDNCLYVSMVYLLTQSFGPGKLLGFKDVHHFLVTA